jgi:acylphosphatase
MKSLHLIVTGNVEQGYFLAWVYDHAVVLGLNGWVRRIETGRAELLAQGNDGGLEKLKVVLKQGGPATGILDVKAAWIDYDTVYDGFEMR